MKKIVRRIGIVLTILLVIIIAYTVSSRWMIEQLISSNKVSMAVIIYNHQIYRGLWDEDCQRLFVNNISKTVR